MTRFYCSSRVFMRERSSPREKLGGDLRYRSHPPCRLRIGNGLHHFFTVLRLSESSRHKPYQQQQRGTDLAPWNKLFFALKINLYLGIIPSPKASTEADTELRCNHWTRALGYLAIGWTLFNGVPRRIKNAGRLPGRLVLLQRIQPWALTCIHDRHDSTCLVSLSKHRDSVAANRARVLCWNPERIEMNEP